VPLLLLLALLNVACQGPGSGDEDPRRFEPEIRAFEAHDRAAIPPPGGIVFVGSSSIKNWVDVAKDFPGRPVLNRGFGGSTLADVRYYEDRVVLRYKPRLVLLYAGDNDLAMGRSPERVLRDYREFVAHLRSVRPGTRLVYVSIKPSPARRALLDAARRTNELIGSEIGRDTLASYVDVFTPMLDPGGQPRAALYGPDSLHMSRSGYLLWRTLLDPAIH
jgi:lysophospholipase L1-like esterase